TPATTPASCRRKRSHRRCSNRRLSSRYTGRLAHHRSYQCGDVRRAKGSGRSARARRHSAIPAAEVISITRAPPYLTVQNGARSRSRSIGVPTGGAMDTFALYAANTIVGNDPRAAALEWALGGGSFRFERDCVFAIAGATARTLVDGRVVAPCTTTAGRAGEEVTVEQISAGRFLYVA